MFERFTDQAREVVVQAQAQARRLGHGYIGCEHLLLAVTATDSEAGEVLRGLGVTPEAVESATRSMLSGGRPVLDREALAAFGIDLDAVRERVEAAFGPGALTRPTRPHARQRRGWPGRRRCYAGPPTGHIPFTPRAKKCLEHSLREMAARHDGTIGVEHVALALTSMTDGLAPRIFARLGGSRGPGARGNSAPVPESRLTTTCPAPRRRSTRLALLARRTPASRGAELDRGPLPGAALHNMQRRVTGQGPRLPERVRR